MISIPEQYLYTFSSLNAIEEFIAAKKIYEKIGFELVGTQDTNENQIFFVMKKKKNS